MPVPIDPALAVGPNHAKQLQIHALNLAQVRHGLVARLRRFWADKLLPPVYLDFSKAKPSRKQRVAKHSERSVILVLLIWSSKLPNYPWDVTKSAGSVREMGSAKCEHPGGLVAGHVLSSTCLTWITFCHPSTSFLFLSLIISDSQATTGMPLSRTRAVATEAVA